MFSLKNFKLVNKLKNIDLKANWMKFSNSRSNVPSREKFIDELTKDNHFVEEDLKIRQMVEEMLVQEFSEDIKKQQSYGFLVDSVVNKLKQQQLGNVEIDEDAV